MLTPLPDEQLEHDRIVEKARHANRAFNFLKTVAANIDNKALSDEEFRDFMRRSKDGMPGLEYPKKQQH